MLPATTATATIRASQSSATGGAEYAYSASPEGNHCQAPPIAPGTNVSLTISLMNDQIPAEVPGIPGCTDEVRSATRSTATYPPTTTTCISQAGQYQTRLRCSERSQDPSTRNADVIPSSSSGRITAFSKNTSPNSSQAAAANAWRRRRVLA